MRGFCVLLSSLGVVFAASSAHAAGQCVAAADRAQDLRSAGKLRAARAELAQCSASTCNAVVRGDCERWQREIDAQMPTIVVHVVDSRGKEVVGARVTIDETPAVLDGTAIPLDPGAHVLRARNDAGDVATQRPVVIVGEKSRMLELRFDVPLEEDGSRATVAPPPPPPRAAEPPPPEPSRSYVLPIVLGSIGVAAGGVFGYFEATGEASYRGLENGCGRTRSCTDADTDPVRAKFIGASVALGVSAVSLGAAVIALLVTKPSSPAAKHIAPNGVRF